MNTPQGKSEIEKSLERAIAFCKKVIETPEGVPLFGRTKSFAEAITSSPQPKSRMEEEIDRLCSQFWKGCNYLYEAEQSEEVDNAMRNNMVILLETYDRETTITEREDAKTYAPWKTWNAALDAQSAARAKWKGEKKPGFTVNADGSVKDWFISEK